MFFHSIGSYPHKMEDLGKIPRSFVSWYIPRYILRIYGPLHMYQYIWNLARYLQITNMLQMSLRIRELPHFSEDSLFIPQAGDFCRSVSYCCRDCVGSFQLLSGITEVVQYSSFFIFHFVFIG